MVGTIQAAPEKKQDNPENYSSDVDWRKSTNESYKHLERAKS